MIGMATTHTTKIGTTPANFSLPLNTMAKNIAGSIPAWPQTDGVTATAISPALKKV